MKTILISTILMICILSMTYCLDENLQPFLWNQCGLSEESDSAPSIQGFSLKTERLLFYDDPTTWASLREPDMNWVEDAISSMTLDEKIGQMLMPGSVILSVSSDKSNIDNYKVGGFAFTGNNRLASDLITRTNDLQAYSKWPLLFSIDAEAGLGARVQDATIFPLLMAFGAGDDPTLTEACGGITARETRSLGIQIAFGPVVDVNTEPGNPIISTRAYSDDPSRVTRLAKGFITGARREGLLCTFKHYPGHGDTSGDSHTSLPLVDAPLSILQNIHIKPYHDLVGTGDIDLVMTAHVWYSAVNPTQWPATLSYYFLTEVLRDEIGFTGLVISDAYGMAGLADAVPNEQERAVVGVEAGLDIILMPPTVSSAFNGIKNAVTGGRIPVSRINESVRRILIAKSRVGLPENKLVNPSLYPTILRHPAHLTTVREVCEKGFTCCKNDLPSTPPLATDEDVLVLTLKSSKTIFYLMPSTYFTTPLSTAITGAVLREVPTSFGTTEHNSILSQAGGMDKVVVAGYDWYKIMSNDQVDLINDLAALEVPVIYVAFGAPYHYLQIPEVDAFYCGYSSVDAMQEVAVEALLGERDIEGALPVYIVGLTKIAGWLFY
jgi:beta-glucosidase-like glycosyl hydrolase